MVNSRKYILITFSQFSPFLPIRNIQGAKLLVSKFEKMAMKAFKILKKKLFNITCMYTASTGLFVYLCSNLLDNISVCYIHHRLAQNICSKHFPILGNSAEKKQSKTDYDKLTYTCSQYHERQTLWSCHGVHLLHKTCWVTSTLGSLTGQYD